ncbi:protein SEH1 isoform X2 [Andrographis paniculata]|uniref:protein SEH1 isoform X2 n=1 Tax=Andrographis paniculata TaxID=175694 RepID=UPI0021E78D86|nr:protein SEH1 isoform X2 [Andrographis paniculata]
MNNKPILTLDRGTRCTAWNYSGQRLAAGLDDGSLVIYDSTDPASSTFTSSARFKVRESSILKVVWVPPEYGDAVACVCADGTLSLWEEVAEDAGGNRWKMCKCFDRDKSQVLDVQFGNSHTCLKLVAAYSDGQVKIYEVLDTLELEKWQLQAEFQNVVDLVSKFRNASCQSASISWNPQKNEGQHSSFVLGFNSNVPTLNSAKVKVKLMHDKNFGWTFGVVFALPGRFGSLIWIIKDGFQLQNFLHLRIKGTRFMLWLGHQILEGLMN